MHGVPVKPSAAALALVLSFQVILGAAVSASAAELVKLMADDGREVGSYEWPRQEVRVIESDVAELDPLWSYSEVVSDSHVSTGRIALPVNGLRMPLSFNEETGLEKDRIVKLTGKGAENLTENMYEAQVLELRTLPGEAGPEVFEVVLALPQDAASGQKLELRVRLPEPITGVVLPLDAIWKQAGEPPTSWVFPWDGDSIRRVKVIPGPQTKAGVEIPEGVLPGEKYLAGDLAELFTRFELQAPPLTAEEYVAPVSQAVNKRIWSKFLWAWGVIGLVFIAWITWLFRARRSREQAGNRFRTK